MDLEKFSERTYTTFTSRARAADRLSRRGNLWTIALALSSTATVVASILSLVRPNYIEGRGGLISLLSSVLTLVLSLIVSTLRYEARSRDLFHSFRSVQRVSAKAEHLSAQCLSTDESNRLSRELEADYQSALDLSENHTAGDYYRARKKPQGKMLENLSYYADLSRAQLTRTIGDAIPFSLVVASGLLIAWMILTL